MNGSALQTTAHQPMDAVETITLEPRVLVGQRQRVAVSELGDFFARAIPAVAGELARAGVHPLGPPIAMYQHEQGHRFDVTVGFPVGEVPEFFGDLVREVLPGGPAVRAVHVGPYETLPAAYGELGHWFAQRTLKVPEMMWEEYLVGPGAADESAYRTEIVYPLS